MKEFKVGTKIKFKGYPGEVIEANGDNITIRYDIVPFLPVIYHTTVSDRDIQVV